MVFLPTHPNSQAGVVVLQSRASGSMVVSENKYETGHTVRSSFESNGVVSDS